LPEEQTQQQKLRAYLDHKVEEHHTTFVLMTHRQIAAAVIENWAGSSPAVKETMTDEVANGVNLIISDAAQNKDASLFFMIAPVVEEAFTPAFRKRLANPEPLLPGSSTDYENADEPRENFARNYVLAGSGNGKYVGVDISKRLHNGDLFAEWRRLVKARADGMIKKGRDLAEGFDDQKALRPGHKDDLIRN